MLSRQGTGLIGDDEGRHRVYRFLEHPTVETIIGTLLCLNIFVMVFETNHRAECVTEQKACPTSWHITVNIIFLIFYSSELSLRYYVFRSNFWKNSWHLVDLAVVGLGYLDLVISFLADPEQVESEQSPALALVRLMRISRLLRLVRICSFFPDLYVMIRGFLGALLAMFWGMVMISALLMVFSIITVEIVHPLNQFVEHEDEWCRMAFSSTEYCMLHYFQTVFAGDSWGTCNMPISIKYFFTLFIFAGVLVTIQLGFTNLILAVIVDRAAQSREEDVEDKMKQRQQERDDTYQKIMTVIQEVDLNGNGELSLDELDESLVGSEELQNLLGILEMEHEDLKHMFMLMMDENHTTKVNDFVSTLQKSEHADLNTQVLVLDLTLKKVMKSLVKDGLDATFADMDGNGNGNGNGKHKDGHSTTNSLFGSPPVSPRGDIIDSVCKDLKASINADLDSKFSALVQKISSTVISGEKIVQEPLTRQKSPSPANSLFGGDSEGALAEVDNFIPDFFSDQAEQADSPQGRRGGEPAPPAADRKQAQSPQKGAEELRPQAEKGQAVKSKRASRSKQETGKNGSHELAKAGSRDSFKGAHRGANR